MEIEEDRPHETLISSSPEQTHVVGIYRDSGAIEFKIPGPTWTPPKISNIPDPPNPSIRISSSG